MSVDAEERSKVGITVNRIDYCSREGPDPRNVDRAHTGQIGQPYLYDVSGETERPEIGKIVGRINDASREETFAPVHDQGANLGEVRKSDLDNHAGYSVCSEICETVSRVNDTSESVILGTCEGQRTCDRLSFHRGNRGEAR